MITGLHHIALIVSCEKALDFYKLLGFKETFRKIRNNDTIVLMDGNGLQLEVFIDLNHFVSSSETLGLRHLALKVDSLEDEISRLRGAGGEIGSIMYDWYNVRFCFVKDFDGKIVELHE